MPVDTVVARAGFGSAEAMRRAFQNVLGISPTVCRARGEPCPDDRPPVSREPLT
ncbi:hypothetical protein [Streptomyces sp. NPDC047841]|uniref:hypothetical protein n=1 Tax=Streptomyces sp. NPDC047841 TaxID=3154708 RepID=UPI00345498FD